MPNGSWKLHRCLLIEYVYLYKYTDTLYLDSPARTSGITNPRVPSSRAVVTWGPRVNSQPSCKPGGFLPAQFVLLVVIVKVEQTLGPKPSKP